MSAEPDGPGDLSTRFAANETIESARKLTLVRVRVLLVQNFRDRQTEHAVADKLKALVVETRRLAASDARMRQRTLKQPGVFETVPELCLKLFELAGLQHGVPASRHRTK
jgi:hypothetical protein